MRKKSIKISNYIELVKPEYVYVQIIPHKSIRNYNSDNLTKTLATTYKSINNRIHHEQRKLFFETEFKVSYLIDISKSDANFYFIVPKPFLSVIIDKVNSIWNKATVEVLDTPIKEFSPKATRYELSYTKLDAFSLNVNKSSNEPLNSILSAMEIMKDDDRVCIAYNFLPTIQAGWQDRYDEHMQRRDSGRTVDKNPTSLSYILKVSFGFVLDVLDSAMSVLGDFMGSKSTEESTGLYNSFMQLIEKKIALSPETQKKKDLSIIQTQIAVVSESKNLSRQRTNAITVSQSFRRLDGDNTLKAKEVRKKFKITDFNYGIKSSYLSSDEASSLIQIPARSLLEQYNINYIQTEETIVPPELQHGYISLGKSTTKGVVNNCFIEDHKEIGNLPLYILGRQGSGKTTYICNYASYATTRNESILHIDFIRNCEASKDIEKVIDKDKVIILDFTTESGLQSMAYNEIKFTQDMSWFEKQQLANKKTQLTIELLNSVNVNGDPLTSKMERYLVAATDIVYLNENATLKDVMMCLQDFRFREQIINSIPNELKNELSEEISTLNELDEYSKPGRDSEPIKIGTRDTKIEGILDRITLLKRDFYLKKMFNKTPEHNLDFVDAMENGKVILVRLPQAHFKTYVKNVITTFLITKAWLASELRAEFYGVSKRCHVIIDEINQTPTAESYMESVLTQTRKFGLKFVLAGQYLDQLKKNTLYSLKGAGCSFMLLKGTLQEDYNYFKDELSDIFSYEDLKNMPEHSSLNLIQYSKGFSSFITKLPKPI